MPVSKPTLLLSDSLPMEGTSVLMRCVVEKGTEPITYTWEQQSQSGLITAIAKENSSVVSVTRIFRNHTGWFRCLARNEVNQQWSDRIWLNVLCKWKFAPHTRFHVYANIHMVISLGQAFGVPYTNSNWIKFPDAIHDRLGVKSLPNPLNKIKQIKHS